MAKILIVKLHKKEKAYKMTGKGSHEGHSERQITPLNTPKIKKALLEE